MNNPDTSTAVQTIGSTLPYDLEFLLRAAPESKTARDAIELVAQHTKAVVELKLKIAQERIKLMDPVAMAKEAQATGQDL